MLSLAAKRLAKETITRLGSMYHGQHNRQPKSEMMDKHKEAIKRLGWREINTIFSDYKSKDFGLNKSELKRTLEVVVRVVYGNSFWHDVDFCRSCETGIWTMCECSTCTSTTFPGWVNYRTGKPIEPTETMLRSTLKPFFHDSEALEEMIDVVDQMGTRILQADVLRWVANHHKSIGFGLKARTQLETRSRLSNQEISHSELSDGQLLMAINICKSLNVGLLR